LLGDGEGFVAGEGVDLVGVAVLGEHGGGDCGDVSGVDGGKATGANRVEDEVVLADAGDPFKGVEHESAGPQDRGGYGAGADDLLAFVVPASHRRHRVTHHVDRGQQHDVAYPGSAGGGDRVLGLRGADAGSEQEQALDAGERRDQGLGDVQVPDAPFDAFGQVGGPGRIADQDSRPGALGIQVAYEIPTDVPRRSGYQQHCVLL
jgi:hypothetical protein